jgi:replicative DNA helicase
MTPRRRSDGAPIPTDSPSGSASTSIHETGRLKDELWPAMARLENLHRGEPVSEAIATGFRELDLLIGGIDPGEVVVVAGRPSMGKTAFALNLVANVALDANTPTLLFALESTKEAVVNRLIVAEARVDSGKFRRGKLSDEEFIRVGRAAGTLTHAPIWIDELPERSFDQLMKKIRQFHAEAAVKMVVIDYLQLLEGPMPRAENRNQELSAMSRALKGLAKQLRIAIVVLSQCSRAPEQRTWHRPILTDIRDSGAIEEDADAVLLLYRQEMYEGPVDRDGNSLEGNAEVIVGKRRAGATAFINLYFHKSYMKFDSYLPAKTNVA